MLGAYLFPAVIYIVKTHLLFLLSITCRDVNSNILGDNFTLSLSAEAELKWLKVNKNQLTRIPELTLLHLTHLSLYVYRYTHISKFLPVRLIAFKRARIVEL